MFTEFRELNLENAVGIFTGFALVGSRTSRNPGAKPRFRFRMDLHKPVSGGHRDPPLLALSDLSVDGPMWASAPTEPPRGGGDTGDS